jgi:hypothetical protein
VTQAELNFDLPRGQHLKEEGIIQASWPRKDLVAIAQVIAIDIAEREGEVNIDAVHAALIKTPFLNYVPTDLGNAAGAVFPRSLFEFTGRWVKSARPSNHAHQNRVWKLKEVKQ